MSRLFPVEAFDHAGEGVFVSNEEGRIEYCNPAMAELLQLDRQEILGQSCCELMRLRSKAGAPLCAQLSECPVHTDARNGSPTRVRRALLPINGNVPIPTDLYSVAVSVPVGNRVAILHVIRTTAEAQTKPVVEAGLPHVPDPCACLTPREREVLQHLSNGEGTKEIAEKLFVSTATVRNHVRAILSKLKVHNRIEAILLGARGAIEDPATNAPLPGGEFRDRTHDVPGPTF